MQVSLFIPCLVDQFQPRTAANMIRVFKRLGLQPDYSNKQTCCGQPFFKTGYWKKAVPLAKNIIEVFADAEFVVAPSGSCVNMIRSGYLQLFHDDPAWLPAAQKLSEKVFEFSEFLIRIMQVEKLGSSFKAKVTYHDSCQVLRGLNIASEPRRLLKNVQKLEFLEMDQPDICCGFGGIFSFKFPRVAASMVAEKVKNIAASGAEVVTGCEISCLMHIDGYIRQKDIPLRTLHLADILAQGL
jgi:L-lactate dehydrogenase complex protein LldE